MEAARVTRMVPLFVRNGGAFVRSSLILLVCQSEDLAGAFAAPLAGLGYGVLTVCGMEQATQYLHSHRPDLALLDCRLGPRDLLRARSTLAEGLGIPLVYLSGDGSRAETGPGGMRLDAECLVPPFTAESLRDQIQRHMEQAAAEAPVRTLQLDDVCVNPKWRCACRAGLPLRMSLLEIRLLTALLSRPDMVLTKSDLAEIWGRQPVTRDELGSVSRRIRLKLGPSAAWKIHHEKDVRCWLERPAGVPPVSTRVGPPPCPDRK